MIKRWLYYITPFILASLFCLFGVYAGYSGDQEGDRSSGFAMIVYGCVLVMLLIADYLVRRVVNGNVLHLWILELIGLVALVGMFMYISH
ncbi:hypothetical protein GGD38_004167 [Chitinophagaceae bacterium OAS944]|nr:hypothetical protein [Chitinophagaceae bacterium OAS944]